MKVTSQPDAAERTAEEMRRIEKALGFDLGTLWQVDPMAMACHLTRNETGRNRWRRYKWQEIITRELVKAVLGVGHDRIIITAPPRHGKSDLVDKWFPLWLLNRNPQTRVVVSSYEHTYASEWGGKVRALADKHAAELRFKRAGHGSADEWYVEGNSDPAMRCVGVGGPITGKGADVLIIDDPVKNAAEANSITYREKTWDWWLKTVSTRIEPGGICIIIMTRWHHDDLVGRLLHKQEEDQAALAEAKIENARREAAGEPLLPLPVFDHWHVVKMKAIAEDEEEERVNGLNRKVGDPLCPERYDETALGRIMRRDLFTWRSLYQQEPTAESGDLFERAWFRYFTTLRNEREQITGVELSLAGVDDEGNAKIKRWPIEKLRFFQTVDPAASESNRADYFVDSTFAVTPDEEILVWDVLRDRIPGPRQVSVLRSTWERHGGAAKVGCIGVETVAFQLTLFQSARANGLPVIEVPVDRDKISRAQIPATRCATECMFFRANASWLDEFERELLEFPNGTHDDQVDTLSAAAYMVTMKIIRLAGRVDIPEGGSLGKDSAWVDAVDSDDEIDEILDREHRDEVRFRKQEKRARGLNI